MGLQCCIAGNACSVCLAHRELRGEYDADLVDFIRRCDLYNDRLKRTFWDPTATPPTPPPYNLPDLRMAYSREKWPDAQRQRTPLSAKACAFGQERKPLMDFTAEDIVFDELHCLLRVVDKLLDGIFRTINRTDTESLDRFLSVARRLTKIPGLQIVETEGVIISFCCLIMVRQTVSRRRECPSEASNLSWTGPTSLCCCRGCPRRWPILDSPLTPSRRGACFGRSTRIYARWGV